MQVQAVSGWNGGWRHWCVRPKTVPCLTIMICRWGGPDEEQIKACGHDVHLLQKAGHWVHTDNPRGLLEIM